MVDIPSDSPLDETDFPIPEIPIAKGSLDKHGVVRVLPFLSAEISSGLNLFRSGACCHCLCKLIGASVLSGLEDIVSSGSSSPSSTLPIFLPSLSQQSLSLWKKC